jgi:hypothetical protein
MTMFLDETTGMDDPNADFPTYDDDVNALLDSFINGGGYSAIESSAGFYPYGGSDRDVGAADGMRAGDGGAMMGDEPGMLGTLLGGARSAVNWIGQNPEIAKLGGLAVGGIISGKNARDAQRAAAARDDKSWERQRQAEAEDRQRMNDSIKGLDPIFKGKGPMPALRNRDGSEIIKKGRYQ